MGANRLFWLVPSLLPALAQAASGCSDLTLSITASAQGHDVVIPNLSGDDSNIIDDIVNGVVGDAGRLWPLIPVGGTYDISATYCEPETYNSANAVQLLVHGQTYNKLYWSGLGLSSEQAKPYDWTRVAMEKGYATLAIDRIGAGNSSHPDPLLEVQETLEAEINHQIVSKLRNGDIGGKKFSKVVYVGHSVGSLLGMRSTQLHPEDYDALLLTGWSGNFLENFPKIAEGVLVPAATEFPTRFGELNPLYFVLTLRSFIRQAFYGPDGSFDPAVELYDYEHRDICGLGELVSILAGTTETNYAGPVHIINGDVDAAFCDDKCVSGPKSAPGSSWSLFPKATSFTYDIIPNTGHCLNVHHSSNETFMAAHDFLASKVEQA